MTDFAVRFFLCNLFISGALGLFLLLKRIFQNTLSGKLQYYLWFPFLGLLAIPFLPLQLTGFLQMPAWLASLHGSVLPDTAHAFVGKTVAQDSSRLRDFALSVNGKNTSGPGAVLFIVWFAGIFVMLLFLIKSALRLCHLQKSALPLQNPNVHALYQHCLQTLKIQRKIPIYSTAFLKSPILVGFLNPRIYLPIHLISDYNESALLYMLLHELSHYKHKDTLAGYLMNFYSVLYWFNPCIRYALKEMCNDREIACDTCVLELLSEDSYAEYADVLLHFAEKLSAAPFPFSASLGGSRKQITQRILHIVSYRKPTFLKGLKGSLIFILLTVFLMGFAPFLSTYAADSRQYRWDTSGEHIASLHLAGQFSGYRGSFVLYDLKKDTWRIYNREHALLRGAPDSTYKIYDALFALDAGIITPEHSFMAWNREPYPFEAWNQNQTLESAVSSSVNWYFQNLDKQLGAALVSHYIQKIGYRNEDISGDFSSYWLESSLKISPVEQVQLLTKLAKNQLDFAPEHIRSVKKALHLATGKTGSLYGKTGTGRVDEHNVNGWFAGFLECADTTYLFATRIEATAGGTDNASGSQAAKITLSILDELDILHENRY